VRVGHLREETYLCKVSCLDGEPLWLSGKINEIKRFRGQFFKRTFAPTEKFAPWQRWVSALFLAYPLKFYENSQPGPKYPRANPTIVSYNATSSLVRFENKHMFIYFEKRSNLLQCWRCSCKFGSCMIGPRFIT
jgi:hypothetical protein